MRSAAKSHSFVRGPRAPGAVKVIHKQDDSDLVNVLQLRDAGGYMYTKDAHPVIPSNSAFSRAAAKYLQANDRLACDFVRKLRFSTGVDHVDEEDLIQAARLGLWEAIKRFNITKAQRFSTYAYWWMVRYCRDLLRHSRDARIEQTPGETLVAPGKVISLGDVLDIVVTKLPAHDRQVLATAGDIPADDTPLTNVHPLQIACARARLRAIIQRLHGSDLQFTIAPVESPPIATAAEPVEAPLTEHPPGEVSRPSLTKEQIIAARKVKPAASISTTSQAQRSHIPMW